MVWPNHKKYVTWIAFLFAIFPGFQQQPIAVQFILHFSVLDLTLLSIGTMLLAIRKPKRFWPLTLISILSSFVIFSLEYFIGLELLRPILLWMVLSQQISEKKRRFSRTIVRWLPYLVVLISFFIWRIFIFKFPTFQPNLLNEFRNSPNQAVLILVKRILLDCKTVLYDAWRYTIRMPDEPQSVYFYIGLVAVIFLMVVYYLSKLYASENSEVVVKQFGFSSLGEWPVNCLIIGVFSLLAAGLPFWVTLLPVELSFPWDRSMLPFMLGVSLIIVAGLDLIIRPKFQVLILGALISLAVGQHFHNANIYRGEWENLRTYFWQLSWRAPGLEHGTIIVSDDIPLWRYSDNDLTPIINWIYAPSHTSNRIPYKYFDLSTRVGSPLPGLEKDIPVSHSYRNHIFKSTTSQVLAIYYNPPGCIKVFNPQDEVFPNLPATMLEVLPLSDPGQILLDADPPARPPSILGIEPDHDWCYYFEKGDLARQKGDWQEVVSMGDEAFNRSFSPGDLFEYLPFIEGYAHVKDWDMARKLTAEVSADEALNLS